MKQIDIIIIITVILVVCVMGFIISNEGEKLEEKWKEENPGCERIKMCMNGDCEINDYNKICKQDAFGEKHE